MNSQLPGYDHLTKYTYMVLPSYQKTLEKNQRNDLGTVSWGNFDSILEVFCIFLRNEHGKLKFPPMRVV